MQKANVNSKTRITFRIDEVDNFDMLDLKDATDLVYQDIVPEMERTQLFLSYTGNHAAHDPMYERDKDPYYDLKETQKLFDIKNVQLAYAFVYERCVNSHRYKYTSYGFKHAVERMCNNSRGHRYFRSGDVLLAVILNGHTIRLGNKSAREFFLHPQMKLKLLF